MAHPDCLHRLHLAVAVAAIFSVTAAHAQPPGNAAVAPPVVTLPVVPASSPSTPTVLPAAVVQTDRAATASAGNRMSRREARQLLDQEQNEYIAKFNRTQILDAQEDWVAVQRSGVVWVWDNNDSAGPGKRYRVEIRAGKLNLVTKGEGKVIAWLPIPGYGEVAPKLATVAKPGTGEGNKGGASNPAGDAEPRNVTPSTMVTITDNYRPAKPKVAPAPKSISQESVAFDTAPSEPKVLEFPPVRPPQANIYDSRFDRTMSFLLRDTLLGFDFESEVAATRIDQFKVEGNLPKVMRDLGNKTALFIVRQGDTVTASKTRNFRIDRSYYSDASVLIEALKELGAKNIVADETGIRFRADQGALRQITEWIKGAGA